MRAEDAKKVCQERNERMFIISAYPSGWFLVVVSDSRDGMFDSDNK